MSTQPTQFDGIADAVLSGPIGEALPVICGRPGGDRGDPAWPQR